MSIHFSRHRFRYRHRTRMGFTAIFDVPSTVYRQRRLWRVKTTIEKTLPCTDGNETDTPIAVMPAFATISNTPRRLTINDNDSRRTSPAGGSIAVDTSIHRIRAGGRPVALHNAMRVCFVDHTTTIIPGLRDPT